jgi:hypothetical protein
MLSAPPYVDAKALADPDPWNRWSEFTRSERGRLERLWITFLMVLVEAWESTPESVRGKIGQLTDLAPLAILLQREDQLAKLRGVRDYMVHRDVRQYWDEGRTAMAGELPFYSQLHNEFSRILLAALDWANSVLKTAGLMR